MLLKWKKSGDSWAYRYWKPIYLLVEEVGELAKYLRKLQPGMRLDSAKQYSESVADEIADVLMVLTAVANRLEVDFEDAFREKEEVNKQRVWR